jgi:hypothetical protein
MGRTASSMHPCANNAHHCERRGTNVSPVLRASMNASCLKEASFEVRGSELSKFKVKHFSHATLRRMPLAIMPAILYISYLSSSGSPWTHFGTYISTPTFGRGLHAFQASTAMHPDDYRACPKSRNGLCYLFFAPNPLVYPVCIRHLSGGAYVS